MQVCTLADIESVGPMEFEVVCFDHSNPGVDVVLVVGMQGMYALSVAASHSHVQAGTLAGIAVVEAVEHHTAPS